MQEYVLCCNGVYEIVHGEYFLEVRINDLLDEGFTPDDIMVFDIDTQLK